jgi:pimeloyl-ACP methyl ester carboxylesterase
VDGWYIPGNSDKTVIFSHGYGGNREEFWVPIYDLARSLHRQDYNVLMFDYGYARPGSTGIVTGGVQESQELLGAIDYIKRKGAEQIYIWGFSMGAGTALQAALDSKDISGMILDSTFLLEPDTLYHNMKQYVNLPRFPSLMLVRLFFPILNGSSLREIPYEQVKEAQYPMPILFIHGTEDGRAPYEMTEEIFSHQQAQPQSQLWLVENGKHELLYKYHRRQYLQKTLDFLHQISLS